MLSPSSAITTWFDAVVCDKPPSPWYLHKTHHFKYKSIILNTKSVKNSSNLIQTVTPQPKVPRCVSDFLNKCPPPTVSNHIAINLQILRLPRPPINDYRDRVHARYRPRIAVKNLPARCRPKDLPGDTPEKFIILNAKFLVLIHNSFLNAKFLVLNAKFMTFTHLLHMQSLAETEPVAFTVDELITYSGGYVCII